MNRNVASHAAQVFQGVGEIILVRHHLNLAVVIHRLSDVNAGLEVVFIDIGDQENTVFAIAGRIFEGLIARSQ